MTPGAYERLGAGLTGLYEVLDGPPRLSQNDRAELYLLGRHFSISAHEARCIRPAWEIDLLLHGLSEEMTADGS